MYDQVKIPNPNNWPVETGNQHGIYKFYGDINSNQTLIELPYIHRLSWNKSTEIKHLYCHQKVHDSMRRVLSKVLKYYKMDKIRELGLDVTGGLLKVKRKRDKAGYSLHSWGIAVDYDPDNNRFGWNSDQATLSKPAYAKWWEFWEEEGWISVGRARNYNWMHIQAARLLKI